MSISNIFNPIRNRVRRYFRQHMMPMSTDEAMEKREFLAKIYFLSSFSIFTYLLYCSYKQKIHSVDKSIPLGEATIEKLKIDGKTRIMRFEGFKKVEDYYYERKGDKKDVNPTVELLVETPPEGESEVL